MMDCSRVREWLRADLDGAAEPSAEAAAHLERCRDCAAEAGRLQALGAAARAALPHASVPIDFTDAVMNELIREPSGDRALAEAVRPRRRAGLVFVAVLAVVAVLVLSLRPGAARPAVSGELRVERDGDWSVASRAADGDSFGLEPCAAAAAGGLAFTALEPSLLRAEQPVFLDAGCVLFESRTPARVRTALAGVRLDADSACVVRVAGNTEYEKGVSMSLAELERVAPRLVIVTVLAGCATVANAQGEQAAGESQAVAVEPGRPPALDEKALLEELQRIRRAMAGLQERVDVLTRRVQEVRKARDEISDEPFVRGRVVDEKGRPVGPDGPPGEPFYTAKDVENLRRLAMARLAQADRVRKSARAELDRREEMLHANVIELEHVIASLEQAKDEKSLARARAAFVDTQNTLQGILASFRETGRREKPSMEELAKRAKAGDAQARKVLSEWLRDFDVVVTTGGDHVVVRLSEPLEAKPVRIPDPHPPVDGLRLTLADLDKKIARLRAEGRHDEAERLERLVAEMRDGLRKLLAER